MVYNTFSLHELTWFQKFNLEFVSHESHMNLGESMGTGHKIGVSTILHCDVTFTNFLLLSLSS